VAATAARARALSQRLFVGVGLDPDVRGALERGLESARRDPLAPIDARWVPAESWHFTLQFLGGVADDAVAGVQAACARAANACASFELELGGLGAFSSPRAARVIWVGVTRGAESMVALHAALLAQTEPLGFARETRPFSPHLTVARLKRAASVESLLARVHVPAMSLQVGELVLFRSHVSAHGSRYEAVGSHRLGGAG